jgi:hypothetical protein
MTNVVSKIEMMIDNVNILKESITKTINDNISHIITVTTEPGLGCDMTLHKICTDNNWQPVDVGLLYDIPEESNIYDEIFKTSIEKAKQDPDQKYVLFIDSANLYKSTIANAIFNMLFKLKDENAIPDNLIIFIEIINTTGLYDAILETLKNKNYIIYDYNKCFRSRKEMEETYE